MLKAKEFAGYYNTEDPITLESLQDIDPKRLYTLDCNDVLYGFDIDSLFEWCRKTRNLHPITNYSLTPLQLELISEKYVSVHQEEGIVKVQLNTIKGCDYGLLIFTVGDLSQVTFGDLLVKVLELAPKMGIDDFQSVKPRFIYAGRIFYSYERLSDVPNFVSGHKVTISP